jgi:hypothetical protein
MANSYRQWSEVIEWSTEHAIAEQKTWVEAALVGVEGDGTEQNKQELAERGVVITAISNDDTITSWPDFERSFVARGIWLRSEEGGDLEHLAAFVQSFLKKFAPNACLQVCWADWCDKLRAGEFGGGVVVVWADKVKWANASDVGHDVMIGRYEP